MAATRTIFADVFFEKKRWMAVNVSAKNSTALPCEPATIRLTTLAELAELSVAYPTFLDAAVLLRARDLIRRGSKPWLAEVGGVRQAVAWTITSRNLSTQCGEILLEQEMKQVHEIWPLGGSIDGLVPILAEIASSAAATGLRTIAVCPEELLGSAATHGLNALLKPAFRWATTHYLGMTSKSPVETV